MIYILVLKKNQSNLKSSQIINKKKDKPVYLTIYKLVVEKIKVIKY